MIRNLAGLSVAVALIVMSGTYALAQEPDATTTEEQVITDPIDEPSGEISEETSTEEELTEEEIQEILDETEVLTEDDIESLDDIEGEVIAVTDEGIIIEQPSGEIIVVDTETYENITRGGGGGRKASKGQKVESGIVSQTGTNPMVTTKSGVYPISSNTSIIKNGKGASLSDLKDGDKIVAVLDSNGNLIVLELASRLDKARTITVFGSLLALAAILALFGFSKMKDKKDKQVS